MITPLSASFHAVQREEFINAGVILYCRPACYLAAQVELDCVWS